MHIPKPLMRHIGSRLITTLCIICGNISLSPNVATAQITDPGLSISASGTYDGNEINFTPGVMFDEIELLGTQAIIDFETFEAGAPGKEVTFLAVDNNVEITSGLADFTLLIRITTPGYDSPVRIDGNILSTFSGNSSIGGNIWVYSPAGIILGSASDIQTGAILLSTSTINPSDVAVGNLDVHFTGITVDTSEIAIESTAIINCENNNSYVVCIAPKVNQAGTINVNGSVALVAAEEGTITSRNNVFDIDIQEGSSVANAIIHEGTTTGPASTGITDEQEITLMSVPKIDSEWMTMQIAGSIGFNGPGATDDGDVYIILNDKKEREEVNIDISGTTVEVSTTSIDIMNTMNVLLYIQSTIEMQNLTIQSPTIALANCINGTVNNPDDLDYEEIHTCYETFNIDSVILIAPPTVLCGDSIDMTVQNTGDSVAYYILLDACPIMTFESTASTTSLTVPPQLDSSNYQVYGHHVRDSSISLDGNSTSLRIEHSPNLRPTDQMTISAWVLTDDLISTTFQEIYRKEDGNDRHLFSFQEGGTILSFGLQSSDNVYQELDALINKNDFENKWVHVAATYDGNYQRIFINGVIIDSLAMTGTLSSTGTQPAYIGSSGGVAEFFDGKVDDVTLWYRALSPTEIQALMSNDPQYSLGLIFYFDMDSIYQDSVISSYNKPIKAAILSGNAPHLSPDTLLSSGAWEPISNLIGIQCLEKPVLYVDHTATGDNNGSSWEHAFLTLESAIMKMTSGDTIFIAEGIYPIEQTINVTHDLRIIGSHPSGGGPSNFLLHQTIIRIDQLNALNINAPLSEVILQAFIIDKIGSDGAELEILKGTVELEEVEVR